MRRCMRRLLRTWRPWEGSECPLIFRLLRRWHGCCTRAHLLLSVTLGYAHFWRSHTCVCRRLLTTHLYLVCLTRKAVCKHDFALSTLSVFRSSSTDNLLCSALLWGVESFMLVMVKMVAVQGVAALQQTDCLDCWMLKNAPTQQGKAAPTPAQIAGDARMERVTAAILSGAPRFSAADVYDGLARLAELAARARIEFTRIDFLLVPSALHHYLISGAGLA